METLMSSSNKGGGATHVLWNRVICLFQAHGLNENSLCVNACVNCAVTENRVASRIRFVHTSCAQGTLLYLRILRVRRSLN